jgi:ABC-2 type transport system permease protein
MTGTIVMERHPRGRVSRTVHDTWVITRRNLIRMRRLPEVVAFRLIQPIMIVLVLAYVFGGAISVPGGGDRTAYREFVMAGIFANSVTSATSAAAAGIAEDMQKGLIDRFRSLPMSRGAVLTGRCAADLVQTALTMTVMIGCALVVGWRAHDGLLKALVAVGLLLFLGHAFSWIGALLGVLVRSPEAATSGALLWLFPLTFLSNAFVPTNTLPDFLRHVAEWNPFSATVQAARRLFGNPGVPPSDAWPMRHSLLASVLWSVLIIVVFRTLTVRRYRSASTGA